MSALSGPRLSGQHLSGPRLIVAVDVDTLPAAQNLASQLDPAHCRLKVGKELFTRCGPVVVEYFHKQGFEVFLDLKFHDIPNTTAKAVKAAADLGVWMVNVHCSGGSEMMQAAREVLEGNAAKPLLIGVTVLTSMDQAELNKLGYDCSPAEQVERLATLAKDAGLDGVVSSAQEAKRIKQLCGDDFVTVTPGIRPANAAAGDQKRIMTPSEAIQNGSDFLVVGRPITQAEDPGAAAREIHSEISGLA